VKDFDVCIIGSGAGGGPVALTLAEAGHDVLVLEKGPWFREEDFYKDELACCRRSVYTPNLKDEQHVIEDYDSQDAEGRYRWKARPTSESNWDFWNGNCVGGSSNFMSGFFYRLKPQDFRLHSEFGAIPDANMADWPIDYDAMEPYYTRVEHDVGISGKVQPHPFLEPRSTADFPYPPTREHPVTKLFDAACKRLKLHPLKVSRAILPKPADKRRGCEYSGFCGSYGCSTGAKGSSRAALLDRALLTGHCEIRPHAKVNRLVSDARGRVQSVEYIDADNKTRKVSARIFVVACQAVETSRLLLLSTGPQYPTGLGNAHGQVGKNLLFSAGGSGYGDFPYDRFPHEAKGLKLRGPFVNRGLQDWYVINDAAMGGRLKGGTIDFLMRHPNPMSRANQLKWNSNLDLIWGKPLKKKLKAHFTEARYFRYEVFCDWLPVDDCFVSLDSNVKDKWGVPVARVRVGYHEHNLKVGHYLSERAKTVMREMNAVNVRGSVDGSPPTNLMAGGCRFGMDPKSSVLDPNCRIHGVDNVFVTDGSFMPTGGSVPYTWTIYANAFRVADIILKSI